MSIDFDHLFEVRDYLNKLPVDEKLESYSNSILREQEINNIIVLKNQFFYITAVHKFENVFVHPNIMNILGYQPEFFMSIENVYAKIHPDDRDFVLEFSKRSINYSTKLKEHTDVLKYDPNPTAFSIDFRMQKSDGSWIRVNRLTGSFKWDQEYNMIYSISLFADITHLNKGNIINYAWTGDFAGNFNVDDLKLKYFRKLFTKREIEVLKCIVSGLNCKDVAARLFISEHTVSSHRKNMLHKIQARNTAELVNFAANNGLL